MSQSALSSSSSASSASAKSSSVSSALSTRVRRSESRGHANHGWLNSYHTFSFASYYDPKFSKFHSLRVINEDRVAGGQGFGMHPHSNYEIFSYVMAGAVAHKDTLGNTEIIHRGDVQFTSAGSGIEHSEYNGSDKEFVHFLQIWVKPDKQNLKPRYSTMHFADKEKEGQLRPIVAPSSFKSQLGAFIPINQDLIMYASILRGGQSVSHAVAPGRAVYIHLIQDVNGFEREAKKVALNVNGKELKAGDGVFIERKKVDSASELLVIRGDSEEGVKNEFLLFDIKAEAEASNDEDDD